MSASREATLSKARALEDELVALVATLPDLPSARLRELAADARVLGDGDGATAPAQKLAAALAAALERFADGAAPLEGWGLVAQAASTLGRALAAPATMPSTALAATTFELDSLAAPAASSPKPPQTPDVPLTALTPLRRRT
ncbi:MAG TPA: hypothetical protein VM261_24700 [Kofleriaceae bacterium]|nr:hypothetical protein [Kofleriaceae bacterium]